MKWKSPYMKPTGSESRFPVRMMRSWGKAVIRWIGLSASIGPTDPRSWRMASLRPAWMR
jgi:hypothetical protein